jgi:ADP-ribose pyrophosphatase YjhB (NUDIX family)
MTSRYRVTVHLLAERGTRWLIVRDARVQDRWRLPSARVRPEESPAEAVARAARTELGLTLACGPLLVVAWQRQAEPGRATPVSLVFGARVQLRASDLDAICTEADGAWRLAEPDEAQELVDRRIGEWLRVAAAIGSEAYLEQP